VTHVTRRLEGKRCLVTGGSRGLGLAIGEAFARAGARVAFTYARSDADAEDARARLAALGAEARAFKGSVADAAHVQRTIAEVVAAWDGIDVLVNNAGVNQILPIALIEEADWDALLAVNLKGAYLFSRAALRHMIKARSGTILSIGSFASERVVDAPVHYAASKAALRGFTEALAREVGRHGIRVNLLSPGLLDTGLGRMLPPHRIKEYVGQAALGRTGTAAEVAEAAVFLASSDASFVSAAKVGLDGGL
jgi:NAD(P)-dependent dehydrogenase (short-subunit alcohol dehydrogenase family)